MLEVSARFVGAARKAKVADFPAGPVELDEMAHAVHNMYIKKVERVGGELQNTVIYTYPRVSQLRAPAASASSPACRELWAPDLGPPVTSGGPRRRAFLSGLCA